MAAGRRGSCIWIPLAFLLVAKVNVGTAWSLEDFSMRGLIQKFGPKETVPAHFQHEHVLQLNNTNFEGHIMKEDGKFYFVKFYANWCGHCKTLSPLWAQIAEEKASDSRLVFAQIECSKNGKICTKAAVKGYPDLKVFYNGRIGYMATGGMEFEKLRDFVETTPAKVLEGYKKSLEAEKEKQAKEEEKSGKKTKSEKAAGTPATTEL
jgi:protein disulfide-isomerase-like protein